MLQRRFRRLKVCLYAGVCCWAAAIYGAEPAKDTKDDAAAERLINALANHNQPAKTAKPTVSNDVPVSNKGYRWEEESRAHDAFMELWKHNGSELWPHLARHADDPRYAFTWSDDEDELILTESVGKLCCRVARDDLTRPYMQYIGGYGQEFNARLYHSMESPKELKDLKAWCQARAEKPLYELQIEMCRWAIANMRAAADIAEKPKIDFIRNVEGQIQELAKAKKPLVREKWHSEIYLFNRKKEKDYRWHYSHEGG